MASPCGARGLKTRGGPGRLEVVPPTDPQGSAPEEEGGPSRAGCRSPEREWLVRWSERALTGAHAPTHWLAAALEELPRTGRHDLVPGLLQRIMLELRTQAPWAADDALLSGDLLPETERAVRGQVLCLRSLLRALPSAAPSQGAPPSGSPSASDPHNGVAADAIHGALQACAEPLAQWMTGHRFAPHGAVALPVVATLVQAGAVLGRPDWIHAAMHHRDRFLAAGAADALSPRAWPWASGSIGLALECLWELGCGEQVRRHLDALEWTYQRKDGGIPARSGAGWIDTEGHLHCAWVWGQLGETDRAARCLGWAEGLRQGDGTLLERYGPSGGSPPKPSVPATVLSLQLERFLFHADTWGRLHGNEFPPVDAPGKARQPAPGGAGRPDSDPPEPRDSPAAKADGVRGLVASAPWRQPGPARPWQTLNRELTERARQLACGLEAGKAPRWLEPVAQRVQPGDTVLVLGAGEDIACAWLARQGAAVTLVDLDPSKLDLAEQLFQQLGLRAEGCLADATGSLPFGARQFDLVWCRGILPKVSPEERTRVLREAARLARREVVAMVPNGRCLALRIGSPGTRALPTLKDSFAAAGLGMVSETTVGAEGALRHLTGQGDSTRNLLGAWFADLDPEEQRALDQGEWLLTCGRPPVNATFGDATKIPPADAAPMLTQEAHPTETAKGQYAEKLEPHRGWLPRRPVRIVWLEDQPAEQHPAWHALQVDGVEWVRIAPHPLGDSSTHSPTERQVLPPEDLGHALQSIHVDAVLAPNAAMAAWARAHSIPDTPQVRLQAPGPTGDPALGDDRTRQSILLTAEANHGCQGESQPALEWSPEHGQLLSGLHHLLQQCGAPVARGIRLSGTPRGKGDAGVTVAAKEHTMRGPWDRVALSSPDAGMGHLFDAPLLLGLEPGQDLSFGLLLDGDLVATCPVFRDPMDQDALVSGTVLGGGPAIAGDIVAGDVGGALSHRLRTAAWDQLRRLAKQAGASSLRVDLPVGAPARRADWNHGLDPFPARGMASVGAQVVVVELAPATVPHQDLLLHHHPEAFGRSGGTVEKRPPNPIRSATRWAHREELRGWWERGRLWSPPMPMAEGQAAEKAADQMIWGVYGDTATCLDPMAPEVLLAPQGAQWGPGPGLSAAIQGLREMGVRYGIVELQLRQAASEHQPAPRHPPLTGALGQGCSLHHPLSLRPRWSGVWSPDQKATAFGAGASRDLPAADGP